MVQFYRSLDVMLFSSDWDSMPRAPAEAMAYGVPVVASVLHGGLRELIDRDDCGYLLASHDVGRLAETVLMLLGNPDKARQVGAAGRERVRDFSDLESHVQKLCELLRL
jgi:glycosyltransferase involved in cell wall biosynthesis